MPSLDTDSPIPPSHAEKNSVTVLYNGTENQDDDENLHRAMLESTRMSQHDYINSLPDGFIEDASELMDLQEFSEVPPTLVI